MRDRRELVGRAIGAGEDAEHAGHFPRRCGIDRDNARVRIGRPHHDGVDLAVEMKIVGELTSARDQTLVLLARQGFANEAVAGGVRLSGIVHFVSLGIAGDVTPPF